MLHQIKFSVFYIKVDIENLLIWLNKEWLSCKLNSYTKDKSIYIYGKDILTPRVTQ